jgi:hypothetical protein
METLPDRLQGFLDALSAISSGSYPQGGMNFSYPTTFDRNNLEVTYDSGTRIQRSGGFVSVGVEGVARFFDQALGDPDHSSSASRMALAEDFLMLVKQELKAEELEIWHFTGEIDGDLFVCISPGANERWLGLSWSVD